MASICRIQILRLRMGKLYINTLVGQWCYLFGRSTELDKARLSCTLYVSNVQPSCTSYVSQGACLASHGGFAFLDGNRRINARLESRDMLHVPTRYCCIFQRMVSWFFELCGGSLFDKQARSDNNVLCHQTMCTQRLKTLALGQLVSGHDHTKMCHFYFNRCFRKTW